MKYYFEGIDFPRSGRRCRNAKYDYIESLIKWAGFYNNPLPSSPGNIIQKLISKNQITFSHDSL